jgi:uncharacterized membrane protein YkoI
MFRSSVWLLFSTSLRKRISMGTRFLRVAAALVVAALMVSITGCDGLVSAESRTTWDRATAESLGFAAGAITAEQARQIAEHYTGGTAVSADLATANGTEVYTVRIQTGSSEFGITEQSVNVRVADGAVMKVSSGGCHGHDDDD